MKGRRPAKPQQPLPRLILNNHRVVMTFRNLKRLDTQNDGLEEVTPLKRASFGIFARILECMTFHEIMVIFDRDPYESWLKWHNSHAYNMDSISSYGSNQITGPWGVNC